MKRTKQQKLDMPDEGELDRKSVVAEFATTAADGKTYQVDYYNLDVIISVGYRIKSNIGTQFRIWATNTLREHLIQGYTINRRLLQNKREQLAELHNAISLISSKAKTLPFKGQEGELLGLISEYSESLTLLYKYDKGKLEQNGTKKAQQQLSYTQAKRIVRRLKVHLAKRGEATSHRSEKDTMIRLIINLII